MGWRSKSWTKTFVRTSRKCVLLHFREETPFCPRPQRLHKLTGGGQGCQGDGHTGKQDSERLRINPEYLQACTRMSSSKGSTLGTEKCLLWNGQLSDALQTA